MQYVKKDGMCISKFSLGTVQLGMNYGLGEFATKPSKSEAFRILNRAVELGVNTFDTANDYGDSEQLIGQWLQTKPSDERTMVVTKIGPFDHSSPAVLKSDILRQAEACRKNLSVSCIDMLMVHDFEDYEQDTDVLEETFTEMKRTGLIRYSALSAYSRHNYNVLAASGFDAVQIPLNVFDWGQIENGGVSALERSGKIVFARSVYLQGLVFMKPDELDPHMEFCAPYLKEYLQICEEFGLSPDVLALSFALSVPGISSVVLGCQRLEQLEANGRLIDQTVHLSQTQMQRLHKTFTGIDPRVINPGVWFNHT